LGSRIIYLQRLGLATSNLSLTCRRKGGRGPGLGERPKIRIFSFSIYTMAEARDFKFGTQLWFAKPHHKITPIGKSGHGLALGELPKIVRFHFNIYTMAEARDFEYVTQLGFAKAHHKITPSGKVGVTLG